MEKIFIEVRGGLIQNIQCTSGEIQVFVMDYDSQDPEDHESGWTYWEANGGDQVVDRQTIEDAIVNANS